MEYEEVIGSLYGYGMTLDYGYVWLGLVCKDLLPGVWWPRKSRTITRYSRLGADFATDGDALRIAFP